MGTEHCREQRHTKQKKDGRERSDGFLPRQVTSHLGHEDQGKSFKSAVKLFWYLVQSRGLGLCFLSHFLEQTNRNLYYCLCVMKGWISSCKKNVNHLVKQNEEYIYVGCWGNAQETHQGGYFGLRLRISSTKLLFDMCNNKYIIYLQNNWNKLCLICSC